jgi:hypothetical protein
MSVSQVLTVTVRTKGKMSLAQVFLTSKHGAKNGKKQMIGFTIIIIFLIGMFDFY